MSVVSGPGGRRFKSSLPDHFKSIFYIFVEESRVYKRVYIAAGTGGVGTNSRQTLAAAVQQLREAFPYGALPKFLVFDHDGKYGLAVPAIIESMTITPVRTSIGSPWQNGVAER